MGIKFLCPNGHKLHVKSFLAGKKAICPKCSARVTVPAEGHVSLGESELATAGDASSGDLMTGESAIVETVRSHLAGPDAGADTVPVTAAVAAGSSPTADAIDEAPTAVWYVRPSTGGQFGPASGDIMRAWISEGRVGASSLVWRAGWPDWRSAAATFPQLGVFLAAPGVAATAQTGTLLAGSRGGNGAVPASGSALPMGHAVRSLPNETPVTRPAESSAAVPSMAAPVRPRRRNNDLNLFASIVLILISIILVIVLIVVWRRQGEPDVTSPSEAHRRAPAAGGANAPGWLG